MKFLWKLDKGRLRILNFEQFSLLSIYWGRNERFGLFFNFRDKRDGLWRMFR